MPAMAATSLLTALSSAMLWLLIITHAAVPLEPLLVSIVP